MSKYKYRVKEVREPDGTTIFLPEKGYRDFWCGLYMSMNWEGFDDPKDANFYLSFGTEEEAWEFLREHQKIGKRKVTYHYNPVYPQGTPPQKP